MIREVLNIEQLRAMSPDEAAALWTVRLSEGEHLYERGLFEEWLDSAPGNRQAWDRAQRGWNAFDSAAGDELVEEMRRHARSAGPAAPSWPKLAAVAAAFVLVIAGASIVTNRDGILDGGQAARSGAPSLGPAMAEATRTYTTGRELPKLISLPDGTRMILDANSQIVTNFSPERRTIVVASGRAFFDVRHDSSRPFTVRVADMQAVDLGTKFDVEKRGAKVAIRLVQGRLSVKSAARSGELQMSPGDRLAKVGSGKAVITRSAASGLDWPDGLATFENETVAEAAAVLNRYPGETLIVRDSRVASLRVSGTFRMGQAARFGRTLEQIYPVRVVRRGAGELEIAPAG